MWEDAPMERIKSIRKLTDNRYLNLYEQDAVFRDGTQAPYYVASRRKSVDALKSVTHDNHPDGVILYGVHGEQKDKVVLIRQFRYPINGYVYEFPAGLVEHGEDMLQAGIREMYEETGLEFTPVDGGSYCRPFFTTVGMTDESCGTVYGYCSGTPSNINQEGSEDIQVILADRAECRRILKEENVAIMCAYMLMHFIASEGDPLAFLSAQAYGD
jgi:ADP-ribose pyrophosphatase